MRDKTFNTIEVGQKVYMGMSPYWVREVQYKNGYIVIRVHWDKEPKPGVWQGHWLYIPRNHAGANKTKLQCGCWLHLTDNGYKKFMQGIINRAIEK